MWLRVLEIITWQGSLRDQRYLSLLVSSRYYWSFLSILKLESLSCELFCSCEAILCYRPCILWFSDCLRLTVPGPFYVRISFWAHMQDCIVSVPLCQFLASLEACRSCVSAARLTSGLRLPDGSKELILAACACFHENIHGC